MRRFKRYNVLVAGLFASPFIFTACQKASKSADILVEVNASQITIAQFEAKSESYDLQVPNEAILNDLIEREAWIQVALKENLDQDPEVMHALGNALINALRRTQLEPQLEAVSISDVEVRVAYKADLEKYTRPEQRRVAWIFLERPAGISADKAAELQQRAQQAHAEVQAQAPDSKRQGFGALAQEYSTDQRTRYRGGDMGWLELQQKDTYPWSATLTETIFELSTINEPSELIEIPEGYAIVKLLALREETVTPVEKVADSIRAQLRSEKIQAIKEKFDKKILNTVRIKRYNEAIQSLTRKAEPINTNKKPPSLPR